jgi:hypothetical protein
MHSIGPQDVPGGGKRGSFKNLGKENERVLRKNQM